MQKQTSLCKAHLTKPGVNTDRLCFVVCRRCCICSTDTPPELLVGCSHHQPPSQYYLVTPAPLHPAMSKYACNSAMTNACSPATKRQALQNKCSARRRCSCTGAEQCQRVSAASARAHGPRCCTYIAPNPAACCICCCCVCVKQLCFNTQSPSSTPPSNHP